MPSSLAPLRAVLTIASLSRKMFRTLQSSRMHHRRVEIRQDSMIPLSHKNAHMYSLTRDPHRTTTRSMFVYVF